MFRIRADHTEQFELQANIEKAREFFSELSNFAELMPCIESIKTDTSGIVRWVIRAEVPIIGALREAFMVELTDDSPDRIEFTPARTETKNYLRYAVRFIEASASTTLIKLSQHIELRRPTAKDLHTLAGLIGESRISAELQKRVRDIIKIFLQRARIKLESDKEF
jgi:carbon monoxide dehydrogenase subunit G